MKDNSLQSHHLQLSLQTKKLLPLKSRLRRNKRVYCFYPGLDEHGLESWRDEPSKCRRKIACMWRRFKGGWVGHRCCWRSAGHGNALDNSPSTLQSQARGLARQRNVSLAMSPREICTSSLGFSFSTYPLLTVTLYGKLPPLWLPADVTLVSVTKELTWSCMWWSELDAFHNLSEIAETITAQSEDWPILVLWGLFLIWKV